MRTPSKLFAIGALLALGSAACGDWLSGPGLTSDPNAPSAASRDQRLAAVQSSMTVQLTGSLARAACMWMQECAGVDRQYATLEKYVTTEDDFDGQFGQVYGGGGLVDIRFIQTNAAASGDSVYEGVGKVLEALDVGTAADLWGDIPYSEAVSANPTPHYDSQLSVYTALLGVLDQAIAELAGPGAGPGAVDLWYGGNATKWTQLAHTLKARIYLHLAEQQGTPAYDSALVQAQQGISTSANDLVSYQSSTTSENNVWYQFQIVQRDTYLRMGDQLVDSIMRKRNDPRLAAYFGTISPPAWKHAKYSLRAIIVDSAGNTEQVTAVTLDDSSGTTQPAWPATVGATTLDNHVTWTNIGVVQYAGAFPGAAYDPAVESNLSAARLSPSFRQPMVTHAEVQLIIAEAAFRTGDQVTALDSLNAERTAAGLSAIPNTVVDSALVDSIMIEKYVALFQNIETWNDYKRECRPALIPAPGWPTPLAGTHVIARPLYGSSEANTNPNFPGEPATGRNWNDPNPCPGA